MMSSSVGDGRLGSRLEVIARYEALRGEGLGVVSGLAGRSRVVGQGLIAAVAGTGWVTVRSMHGGPGWPLLVGFAALGGLTVWSLGLRSRSERAQRVVVFYERAIERVKGVLRQSGNTGEGFREEGHLYERDLTLLGPESLFGLLDTVRTGIGQRGLAEYLLDSVSWEESRSRQEAVRELCGRTELRERIGLLGASRFEQVEARFFDFWLEAETPEFSPIWSGVLAATALALTVGLLAGLTHVLPWGVVLEPLLAVAAVQMGIVWWLGARIRPLLEATARLSNHVQMFGEGLGVLDAESFASAKLLAVQARGRQPANAGPELKRLQGNVSLVQQRTKELFYVFSALTAAGTQAGMAVARWKKKNGAAMRGWMDAWAEFEALNALAGYAYEHSEDCWPELVGDGPGRFEAVGLGHPLLAGGVRNDLSLGLETGARFYLISGSNMSGKSTLMRCVGVAAVMAYAGCVVQAEALTISPMRLGAALALTDSLAEGKSKFLAEVERLARIVEMSADGTVLFLVDEIFSGTNSADRQMAAGAVLGRLLERGAIGALSTHDLALADLATESNGGVNVHMASPDAGDPLGFDYKLKAGVNTSSNALAIIRMMGL